ncbi:MAG TPA: glycosyltransferase [Thermoanaerobaculia bacterium]|nr:glycosyltransferase [Thermoanaerobaculia bacterium]
MRSIQAIIVMSIVLLCGCATQSYDTPSTQGMHSGMSMDNSRTALSKAMRDLWTDHVVWTHNYIVAATSDQPDADALSRRLLANQDQIGQAIVPYYGQAAGDRLAALLRDHILIAVDVVKAAKANDQAKLGDADRRWHANAADIATFLSGANPNWSRADVLSMMNEHLALTTQATVARLKKNWTEEIATYDKIFDQAMMMADALSDGIIKQFPDRFRS